MKKAVVRLLGNPKSFYLSFMLGSLCFLFSIIVFFFSNLSYYLVGSFLVLVVIFYTYSIISYVWVSRRNSSLIIRESRALRAEVDQLDTAAFRDLTEGQKKVLESFELFEENLTSTLSKYQTSYLEQLKTQSFNNHLAVQDLKSVFTAESNHDA